MAEPLAFPTIRKDLDFVRKAEKLAADDSDDAKRPVILLCRCGVSIEYFPDETDPPLSKFMCYANRSPWGSLIWGCSKEWTEVDIKKMSDGEIDAAFSTTIETDDETPLKLVEMTNGVTRFTGTRLMTDAERRDYYFEALKEMRRRL